MRFRRRTLLRRGALAATGAAAALSGCGFLGDESDPDPGQAGTVPAGADALVYADVDALTADEPLETGFDDRTAALADAGWTVDHPDSLAGLAALVDERLADVAVSELVVFGALEDAGYGGAVGWTDDDAVAAVTADGEYGETTRSGTSVHEAADGGDAVADLGDGRFAFGTSGAVADVVAVDAGEADPVGTLGEAFGDTDGPLRFVSAVSSSLVPVDTDEGYDVQPLDRAEHLAGSLRTEGDDRRLAARIVAEDDRAATRIRSLVDGARVLARERVEEAAAGYEAVPDHDPSIADLRALFDGTDVEAEENEVTAAYATDAGEMGAVLAVALPGIAAGVLGTDDAESLD